MIDLTKKDQLFFYWFERSENDRGLYFDKGEFQFDWYKVLSKADSRLKIEESLKFKIFDWVTKNIRENFIEILFQDDHKKQNFDFSLNISSEIRNKYKSRIQAFAAAVRHDIKTDGFKSNSRAQTNLIVKDIESLEKIDFFDIPPLKSRPLLNIDIQRIFKLNSYHTKDGKYYTPVKQYFNAFSPNFYQSKFTWKQRKTYSKSVFDLMTGLEAFYRSKSWQSRSQKLPDHLQELAHNTVISLIRETGTAVKTPQWASLMIEAIDGQSGYVEESLVMSEKSDCKKLGFMIGKQLRIQFKRALSHWISYWKVQSKSSAISESLKKAYLDLEKSIDDELDQDLEAAAIDYFDQHLNPFCVLIDYLLQTYPPLSLFISGVIRSFQEDNGDHFLGFSQSALLHHLAGKALHRVPGQFPLAQNGMNPLLISSDADTDWDLEDLDSESDLLSKINLDLDFDLESDLDLDEIIFDKLFRNLYFSRN